MCKDIICPECGAKMQLRYTKKFLRYFYGCTRWPDCDCTHGCHPGTDKPLGTPAKKSTRKMRMKAHAAFDKLWTRGRMPRRDAYLWLAKKLEIEPKDCHIGVFDEATCKKVIEICLNAVLRKIL